MCCNVVGFVAITAFGVIDENRLKRTEETVIGRLLRVGPAQYHLPARRTQRGNGPGEGVLVQQAVRVGKKQDVPVTMQYTDIACPRHPGVTGQPYERAGKVLYYPG